ncbi:Histone transcription regulator 3 [Elsinoe australis]|uniref:Histone transcription regulator 3 n=1 Tax=Elsinoe australis TaxID=40998 RepID=A0A2P8A4Q0_9PEZI|nr:Histone transcription regulator 3 [Elsinoe australis]
MSGTESDLSAAGFGYDIAISTTQASLNSNLWGYFRSLNWPIQYLCFLYDGSGQPTQMVQLNDLLSKTGGINPFIDVPAGTPPDDPKVKALNAAGFAVGVQMEIGIPHDMAPQAFTIANMNAGLGSSTMAFTILFKNFIVLQNTPPGTAGSTSGAWDVWQSTPTQPWTISTNVALITQDLAQNLDTPYFNSHPEQKQALLVQLQNLGAAAYSLQQIVFDLDNAALQSDITFGGALPANSAASQALQKTFVETYAAVSNTYGGPLISVKAAAVGPDPSPFQLSTLAWQISPFVQDGTTTPLPNPSPEQQAVATLDMVGMFGGKSMPPLAPFNWNWVAPGDVNQFSGIIAINRNTINNYLISILYPLANTAFPAQTLMLFQMTDYTYNITLPENTSPKTTLNPSGNVLIQMDSESDATQFGLIIGDVTGSQHRMSNTLGRQSTLLVSVNGPQLTVVQNIYLWVVASEETDYGGLMNIGSFGIVKRTITDTYAMTVSEAGGILLEDPVHTTNDDPTGVIPEWNPGADQDDYQTMYQNIRNTSTQLVTAPIDPNAFKLGLQNLIFPAGQVFTFASPSFSNNQDLISAITFQAVSETSELGDKPTKQAVRNAKAADPSPASLTVKSTTDMMQNYVYAETFAPAAEFEAMQSDDGHAMLFSVDTFGALQGVREQSGQTKAGWLQYDLSTSIINSAFSGSTVKRMGVGQSALDGSMGMGMAVSTGADGTSDNLLLSLGNSHSDTSWVENPAWTHFPFDAVDQNGLADTPPSQILISDIMFTETWDNREFVVVDLAPPPSSGLQRALRYHVEPTAVGPKWVKHDMPMDVDVGSYQSCTGRTYNADVDGVYTAGTAAGASQLVYVPLVNENGSGPPSPINMSLPNNAIASAIATARFQGDPNSDLYGSTDLYAISGSTLYRFAAENQNNQAVAETIIQNDVLSATGKLIAMVQNNDITLWGMNGAGNVWYLTCPVANVTDPTAWNTPVPVHSGATHLAAYSNLVDQTNTIFAPTGDSFYRTQQASATTSKLWRPQQIHITPTTPTPSLSFNSYTTTMRVLDTSNLAQANTPVTLTAQTRVAVYINGLYYLLSSVPTVVQTDASGTLAVTEATADVNGTTITVAVAGAASVDINPMHDPFSKLTTLNTSSALTGASIVTNPTAGGTLGPVQTKALVDTTAASSDDITAAASNLTSLQTVYSKIQSPTPAMLTAFQAPRTLHRKEGGLLDWIETAAGDLYNWLKTGVEHVVNALEQVAENVWHFVVQIGEDTYKAVLSTVEAVVGAVEWVYNAIKTVVTDVIRFVEALLGWDDIVRTKKAMTNVVKLWLQNAVDEIPKFQANFDSGIAAAEAKIDSWAGLSDWTGLGTTGTNSVASNGTDANANQTSSSQSLAQHYQNHAGDMSILTPIPDGPDTMEALVDALINALQQEETTLSGAITQFQQLAHDIPNLSLIDVIKRIVAIFADTLLSSVQVVADALIEVINALADAAFALLDTTIHIPVVSDILNMLGFADISILDLLMWIASVPYDVVYKLVNGGTAPFPDNDLTNGIINADTWSALIAVVPPPSPTAPAGKRSLIGASDSGSTIWTAGHGIAGYLTVIGQVVVALEAAQPDNPGPDVSNWSLARGMMDVIVGVSGAAANTFSPRDPIQNEWFRYAFDGFSGLSVIISLIFSGLGQKAITKYISAESVLISKEARKTGASLQAVLTMPMVFCSAWHFGELADEKGDDQVEAILGEVAYCY